MIAIIYTIKRRLRRFARNLRLPRARRTQRRRGSFRLPAISIRFPAIKTWVFALCAFALIIGAAFGAFRATSGGAAIIYGAVTGFPTFIECAIKYSLPLFAIAAISIVPILSPLAVVVLAARGSSVGYTAAAFLIGGGAKGAVSGFAVMAVQNAIITPTYVLCAVLSIQGTGRQVAALTFSRKHEQAGSRGKAFIIACCIAVVIPASLFESYCAPTIARTLFS